MNHVRDLEDLERDVQEQEEVLQEVDKKPATLKIPRYQPWPEGATKLSQLPPLSEEEQLVRMGYFRKILEEKAFQNVHWYDTTGKKRRRMVDLFTAGTVCQVIDKLNPEQRALVLHYEPMRLIDFIWKLIR